MLTDPLPDSQGFSAKKEAKTNPHLCHPFAASERWKTFGAPFQPTLTKVRIQFRIPFYLSVSLCMKTVEQNIEKKRLALAKSTLKSKIQILRQKMQNQQWAADTRAGLLVPVG